LWQKIVSLFAGRSTPARAESSARGNGNSEFRSRRPETVEVTSPKLYVGNLSYDATETDLFELFKGVGQVKNAEIVSHRGTERSKGFGFVLMTTVDEARRAVEELHDKAFMGRKLVVSGAKAGDREPNYRG
jgi:RNA recognition motif-containing protein